MVDHLSASVPYPLGSARHRISSVQRRTFRSVMVFPCELLDDVPPGLARAAACHDYSCVPASLLDVPSLRRYPAASSEDIRELLDVRMHCLEHWDGDGAISSLSERLFVLVRAAVF